MNYNKYPTQYVRELKKTGLRGRRKSSAFMYYWDDKEFGENNSTSFYAKAWQVGKTTAWEWVQEFNREIESIKMIEKKATV